jgi:hypothetical protein
MQFAIGVTVLECSFVKHSHGPLRVKVGVAERLMSQLGVVNWLMLIVTIDVKRSTKSSAKILTGKPSTVAGLPKEICFFRKSNFSSPHVTQALVITVTKV